MKLIDYIDSNPSIEDMQLRAILFSGSLHRAMGAKQDDIEKNHLITPVELTDGRYGIRALTLTECGEGGIFNEIFSLSTAIFHTADLVDMTELVALLPVEEEI